jgi:glucose/arabinose dehydrogenase
LPCAPFETRPANAPEQKPAFPGQTRGCAVKSDVAFDITVLAKGLENPWAVVPLPNGDLLITEKQGRIRIVSAKGEAGQPIGGLLPVGTGGVSSISEQGGSPPITTRGQVRVIFRAIPTYNNGLHFGSRLSFELDNSTLLTVRRQVLRGICRELIKNKIFSQIGDGVILLCRKPPDGFKSNFVRNRMRSDKFSIKNFVTAAF